MAMTAEEKREYQRAYRIKWREENPGYFVKWRAENLEAVKKKDADYYRRNMEKVLAQTSAWAKANRERKRESNRAWLAANPGYRAAQTRRYQGVKVAAGPAYTRVDWQRYLDLFGERCLACGSDAKITADHVIPLSKGGPNTIDNIQGLCQLCNSSKGVNTHDYRLAA